MLSSRINSTRAAKFRSVRLAGNLKELERIMLFTEKVLILKS